MEVQTALRVVYMLSDFDKILRGPTFYLMLHIFDLFFLNAVG